jgi:hypothetical protein
MQVYRVSLKRKEVHEITLDKIQTALDDDDDDDDEELFQHLILADLFRRGKCKMDSLQE